jgi:hypothetical protein
MKYDRFTQQRDSERLQNNAEGNAFSWQETYFSDPSLVESSKFAFRVLLIESVEHLK